MTPAQQAFWWVATLGNLLASLHWLFVGNFASIFILCCTLFYTLLGLYDLKWSQHNLNRLYPAIAYLRYFLESFRAEIQQYFIANDEEEKPFSREQRTLVYQRAKNIRDTIAFGTQRDLIEENYLSVWHSLNPQVIKQSAKRIRFGGKDCRQPYQAAYLNISAMSFGSLSNNAIEALNLGAKKAGCFHNTGEGGVSPYHLKQGGDLVWQIGSGLFGCRDLKGEFAPELFRATACKAEIKMIEIKLSQGAKPGHGGVLPAAKITDEIAAIRQIPKGKDCISPATNPECRTPRDLLNFIQKLRTLSDGKPIGIKLCVGSPTEFLCLCKAMLETNILPDFITVDGAEGGTGAAPLEFSNHLGMTCLEGLYFVHNALVGVGLREQIRIIGSGKTASSFDLLTKVALGADTVNAARTMMLAIGCIQSRHCNTNLCPTGVATQDPVRSKAIDIKLKSDRVMHFQQNTLHSFYELVGAMGLDDPSKLMPQMIKRRSADGIASSINSQVSPLTHKALLHSSPSLGAWAHWWTHASSERFSSDDLYILSPQALKADANAQAS